MPIVKASALYFALTFAAGWILGPIREFWVIPRLVRTRALMGLVALGMLLIAEFLGTWGLRGLSPTEYLASLRSLPGAVTVAAYLLFATMPILVGPGQGRT
jgi:hypothetical protein